MSRAESGRAAAPIRRVTEGRILVMVEQDMGVVFEFADRIGMLADGRSRGQWRGAARMA